MLHIIRGSERDNERYRPFVAGRTFSKRTFEKLIRVLSLDIQTRLRAAVKHCRDSFKKCFVNLKKIGNTPLFFKLKSRR